MKQYLLILISGLMAASAQAQVPVDIELVPFATGLTLAVELAHAGDERLFVCEKGGFVKIVRPDGSVDATPFLDVDALTSTNGSFSEQGLLGLAFHPNYAENGYFFVNYTRNNGDTRVSRFTVSGDPDVANPDSQEDIITIAQPYGNHNGGCIRFGPDGYLYIGMGDGGSAGDPENRAQNMDVLLGKMLRIDIDNGLPYSIPIDNPFVETTPRDEIWAAGLRNPWKFSFDTANGDMWIGDVGQGDWEEIDYQPAASAGGENYGWRCYEGNHAYNTFNCADQSAFVDAAAEFNHNQGHCSITGGEVYRGAENMDMVGKYFSVDYCSGQFWSVEPDDSDQWVTFNVNSDDLFGITSFGLDINGELYAVEQQPGTIYRVIDADCADFDPSITASEGDPSTLTASGNEVIAVVWFLEGEVIEGVTDFTYTATTPGTYTVGLTTSDGCYGVSDPFPYLVDAVDELATLWEVKAFPNPASDILSLNISGSTEPIESIRLINTLGQVVYAEQIGLSGTHLSLMIDVADIATGHYQLMIEGQKSNFTQTISIRR